MTMKNNYLGIGLGLMACGVAAAAMKPGKKRNMKKKMGKALRSFSELADSISDSMGW